MQIFDFKTKNVNIFFKPSIKNLKKSFFKSKTKIKALCTSLKTNTKHMSLFIGHYFCINK